MVSIYPVLPRLVGPNLQTLAAALHLSESMVRIFCYAGNNSIEFLMLCSQTGVTFLAFGNGSPDVFSTFRYTNIGLFHCFMDAKKLMISFSSAMQSNLGSLALGELIGAASFIVSVVAG
jgi:sodium/potassium/calcium exchanger 6